MVKEFLRELEKKLPKDVLKGYEDVFKIYLKALTQERTTKDKNLQSSRATSCVYCERKIGKSIRVWDKSSSSKRGRKTGIISSVKRFSGNPHDSKTLEESLAQSETPPTPKENPLAEQDLRKPLQTEDLKESKKWEGTAILLPAKKEKQNMGNK
ncbi:hypothetical protein VUJ46_01185 [Chryseobacterium sp. MYb264]|uniref:hypothetical protein n=1 Tax=Chryseobacterium sp. MYb264 TaxID=2745153 RepID=UPI002E105540|nr:hypothetical protein VUJ46_01185 [Chryseobacterium sp. MYb264]